MLPRCPILRGQPIPESVTCKLNLDIFWLKDKTPEESENLPEPEGLAQEVIEDLEAALEQFSQVAAELNR